MLLILFSCFIFSCSNNTGRYQQKHDSTPTRIPSKSELHDATPRAETHSRGGNKHYQVRGKHYQVLKSAENFSQTGIASWYGRKFHGHLTSNGEIYDMYAMSAAHKNLPLPTYLKVVNNENGLSVIVRVNDRGPFHQSRIIDLSYSAAYKLDMLKTGTANVTVTAITDFTDIERVSFQGNNTNSAATVKITPALKTILPIRIAAAKTKDEMTSTTKRLTTIDSILSIPSVNKSGHYIQVFASKSKTQAEKLAKALSTLHQKNTQLEQINGIFRVLIGPIPVEQQDKLAKLLLSIKNNGYQNAFIREVN